MFWAYLEPRGQITEARRVLGSVLAAAADGDFTPATRGDAFFWGASGLAGWQGDQAEARRLTDRFLRIADAQRNPAWAARGLLRRGILDLHSDPVAARESLEVARRLAEEAHDPASDVGLRASLELAELAIVERRLDEAALLADAVAASPLGSEQGYLRDTTNFTIAFIALERGDDRRARDLLIETLGHYHEAGVAVVQDELSCLAAAWVGDDPVVATRLLGKAECVAEETGTPIGTLWALVRERHTATRCAARTALGEERFADCWTEGCAASVPDLLAPAALSS